MPQFSKYKKIVVLAAITIILTWSIISTKQTSENMSPGKRVVGFFIVPIQKAFNYIDKQIEDTFSFFQAVGKSKEENALLNARVFELQDELRKNQDIKLENERLKKMLDIKNEYKNYEFESAQVIGRNPENWNNVIIVDKGHEDGIKINSSVMSVSKALVGRVIEVGSNWSKIMLLTDTDSSVSSLVDRTRDIVITRGDGIASKYGLLKLTYVLADADLVQDDIIISSGYGGIFPKGILIGKVKEIKQEPNELTKYAYIEPATDFKKLEEVFIIKNITN